MAAEVPVENFKNAGKYKMSQFEGKDYGDYFRALEKSINGGPKEIKSNTEPIAKKPPKKGLFGAVISVRRYRKVLPVSVALVCVVAIVAVIAAFSHDSSEPPTSGSGNNASNTLEISDKVEKPKNYFPKRNGNIQSVPEDVVAQNVIMINVTDNLVVAERNSKVRCFPASTTKIMTALVAIENITDMNDTFTMSYEITDPLYIAEATVAGFSSGEVINMTDLLYGTILPSGADACVALAQKISGSEQAFVELMNAKARELGLKNTNFVNTSGLYNADHYTTAEDMAVILRAAMDNELCRKILSTYQYTTASTPQHPDGILLSSTLFSYMYGTEPEGADILGGKTGFVNESGYCIAAFGESDSGKEYICVTLGGTTHWPAIYNQIDLFSKFAK